MKQRITLIVDDNIETDLAFNAIAKNKEEKDKNAMDHCESIADTLNKLLSYSFDVNFEAEGGEHLED